MENLRSLISPGIKKLWMSALSMESWPSSVWSFSLSAYTVLWMSNRPSRLVKKTLDEWSSH